MKKELEDKLMKEFPWMEARSNWTGKKLGFGVPCECDDGWYNLIHDLCKKIDDYYKLRKRSIKRMRILQIKEKFGMMRFYAGNYIEGVQDIIDEHEENSCNICEICGKKGELMSNNFWIKTLCVNHSNELGYKKYGEDII
jgi:hypothetical protein